MSELNGQVLGLLLVVAVFAAMVPTLISLFNGMVKNVEEEVTSVINDNKLGTIETGNRAFITSDLLSF